MDAYPTTESGARAGRREWLGLAVLALPIIYRRVDRMQPRDSKAKVRIGSWWPGWSIRPAPRVWS